MHLSWSEALAEVFIFYDQMETSSILSPFLIYSVISSVKQFSAIFHVNVPFSQAYLRNLSIVSLHYSKHKARKALRCNHHFSSVLLFIAAHKQGKIIAWSRVFCSRFLLALCIRKRLAYFITKKDEVNWPTRLSNAAMISETRDESRKEGSDVKGDKLMMSNFI